MPLEVPQLDDRDFQDLVDEAKKRIPHYTKEWTDHNVSDPGVTLIELFAWMTDILLYRINQVPDLHYIQFMEMLGIKLGEPEPAKVPETFWLSKPQPTPVVVPGGTEVASTQTETETSIVFTTDQDLYVDIPELAAVIQRVTTSDGKSKSFRGLNLRRLAAGAEGNDMFSAVPQVDDALYFGFKNNLSHHILGIQADFDPAGGAGIDPTLPPYIWEASTGEETRWESCDVETDTTKGMNTGGLFQVHLPKMGKYAVDGKKLFWVRARIKEISSAERREGMRRYDKSPRLRKAEVATWGGTVPATHAQLIPQEFLGQSDGTPGQQYQLQRTPILHRQPGETLIVQLEGKPPQKWEEVTDFSDSGVRDNHFTLDSASGEVRLGPAIRQQDGTMKLYGAVPPRGANLVFAHYRYGGGQEGNVQAKILNTLKTAIPFVARVENRQAAWGGKDAESLESAMMRAPALLRSRDRAVTADDFEFLSRQVPGIAIGRVKCLQPRPADARLVAPGQIYVLVIPRLPNPARFLSPEELETPQTDIEALREHLDERRLLTTRLDIRPPAYYWVSVNVQLRAAPGVPEEQVEVRIMERLHRFLNPLTGGIDGDGWQFGRDLFVSDVYQCLQGTPGVLFIRGLQMFTAEPGGDAQGDSIDTLEVVAHGVIASGNHTVEFV